MSLAHVAGILGVLLLVRRRRLRVDPYVDLIFAVLVGGLLGGRLGWWLEHPEAIRGLGDFFSLTRGGLSFFGGLALAFPVYLGFLLLRRLPVWESSDLLAPVLPFSLAIVRLGCFAEGCCHGSPTQLPWGVVPASPNIPQALKGVAIHPSPLYEAGFLLLLAMILFVLNARGKLRAGMVATLCMGSYGLYRFWFDFLRGDLSRPLPAGLSYSQALALLLMALAAGTGLYLWRSRGGLKAFRP